VTLRQDEHTCGALWLELMESFIYDGEFEYFTNFVHDWPELFSCLYCTTINDTKQVTHLLN